ncbi:uncharacterized protein LOC113367672 [Ctenocephalides felis]|uniref:uncharacterized protein LOC113367672 n=1 Tax=Ctenocephalides felis TaxID=7515 RepID=UPI000E6E4B75|nr:uncharacterized protein LOC113367672 [Ctenocephalides felis]
MPKQPFTYGPPSPYIKRGRFAVIPEESAAPPCQTPYYPAGSRSPSPRPLEEGDDAWDFDDETSHSKVTRDIIKSGPLGCQIASHVKYGMWASGNGSEESGASGGSTTVRGRFKVSSSSSGGGASAIGGSSRADKHENFSSFDGSGSGMYRLAPLYQQNFTYGPPSPYIKRGRFAVIPEESAAPPCQTPYYPAGSRSPSPRPLEEGDDAWDFDDETYGSKVARDIMKSGPMGCQTTSHVKYGMWASGNGTEESGASGGSTTVRGRFKVSSSSSGGGASAIGGTSRVDKHDNFSSFDGSGSGMYRLAPLYQQNFTYGPPSPYIKRGRFAVIPEESAAPPCQTPYYPAGSRSPSPRPLEEGDDAWDFDDEEPSNKQPSSAGSETDGSSSSRPRAGTWGSKEARAARSGASGGKPQMPLSPLATAAAAKKLDRAARKLQDKEIKNREKEAKKYEKELRKNEKRELERLKIEKLRAERVSKSTERLGGSGSLSSSERVSGSGTGTAGSRSGSSTRSGSLERRQSGEGGRHDEREREVLYQLTVHGTASPNRRPAIFDAFRPRSKSDARKQKELTNSGQSGNNSGSSTPAQSGKSGLWQQFIRTGSPCRSDATRKKRCSPYNRSDQITSSACPSGQCSSCKSSQRWFCTFTCWK